MEQLHSNNMKFLKFKQQSGQSLIELMVTVGLAAVLLPALLTGFVASRSGRAQAEQRQQALAYMKEGDEAMRVFREAYWPTFSADSSPTAPGTVYKLQQNSGTWQLATGSDPLSGGFTRSITILDVYRNPSTFAIVDSTTPGAVDDPSTKQVTITVTWNKPIPNSSVSTTEYFTRYGNTSTSQNGTLQPAASGGDWCNPVLPPIFQTGLNGTLHAVNVSQAPSGGNVVVFAGAGQSANGNTYANINLNDPSSPTAPSLQSINNGNYTPKIKTNGAFNDTTYGYLATQQHSNQGQGTIVNLSNLQQIATLDLGNSGNGQSIYVMNNFRGSGKNIAFLTDDNKKLYAFDITSLNTTTCTSSSVCHYSPITGSSIVLDGIGLKVIGNTSSTGTFAYVATNSTSNQLDIVNVTTTSSPTITARISVGNSQPGVDVFLDSTRLRAYLVTNKSATLPDFFTIDVNPGDTTPAWYKQILNKYTTTNSMNPSGVVFVSGSKAVIVGTGGTRNYQVVDASPESVPATIISSTSCPAGTSGGLNVSYDIYGITTLFSHANRTYSYIITADSGNEFKVIEGGTGVVGSGDGTYTSSPIDAGHPVAWNYFTGTSDTNLSYQIAIAPAPCSSATYTFSNILTGPIALPGTTYTNPGQCLEYKVINNGSTAKSWTVTFNYSL